MKRYTFEINGVTKFRNVSPENEQKFFDKYGEYNPTLVPEEPGKSQGTSLSQNNQKKDTESKSEDGSLGQLKDESYFYANNPNKKQDQPLQYKVDNKGKRLYVNPITNKFEKEVNYKYDRSKGIRFDKDTYGKFLDNMVYDGSRAFNETWLGEIVARGISQVSDTGEASDVMMQGQDVNLETVSEWVKANKEKAENYVESEKMKRFQEKYEKEGRTWTSFFKNAKEEPSLMAELLIQSYSGLIATGFDSDEARKAATVGGGVGAGATWYTGWGALVGGTAGAMGGLATSMEASLTFGELVQEALNEKGQEFTDENVLRLLQSDEGKKIRNRALGRGLTIGAVEALSGGLAGRATTTVLKSGARLASKGRVAGTAVKLGGVGTGLAVEGLGGGTGEVLGRIVAGQKMDPAEIGFEAFTGGAVAPITVASSVLTFKNPQYKLNGEITTYDKMKDFIDTGTVEEIAKADIKIENDLSGLNSEAFNKQQKYIISTQVDSRVSGKDRDKLVDLELELLKTNKETVSGKNKAKDIENKIKEITDVYADVDITAEDVAARESLRKDVKKVRSTIKLTETIKFAEQGGKVIGKDVLIADEDGDAQALYDMAKDEYNSKNPENPIRDEDVQGADGFIVGDIIVINKDVASKTGQINVGAHELLHGVLTKHMKGLNTNEQTNLISEFTNTITAEQKNYVENIINERNKAGENLDLNTTEEWLTVFSDGITKGDITFNEGVFDKLKNFIQEIARKVGINKEFQNGRQVYNFMKDYQASIKKGQLSTRAIELAEGGATVEDAKLSKSQNPAVDNLNINLETNEKYTQKEWNKSGADRALTQMERGNMLDGLIAAKYKVRPIPSGFITKVYSEITNHVRNFKVNENDSLFGWINSYLKFKAGNVFIAETKGAKPKDVKTVDIDAKTTEGAPVVQVEDTSTNMETLTDNINYFQTEVQPQSTESKAEQSKLRVELGIKNIGKSEIFRKVKTALATSKAVDDKGFLKSYEKSLSSLLEPTISKILNDPAKIKKFRRGILEAIPIKTLVQMQKFLPNKIFVKDHGRQTNLTNLSKFVEKGLLPADILNNTPESKKRRAAGVRVYERLNTTTEQFENYIDATIEGKRQKADKSGTRGNNRAKVISEVAKAIGKDATPETLTKDFVQDYLNIKDLKGKITSEKVIEKISETIDRPADLKFSRSNEQAAKDISSYVDKDVKGLMKTFGFKNFNTSFNKRLEKYISKKTNKLKDMPVFDEANNDPIINLMRDHLPGFFAMHPNRPYREVFQSSMANGNKSIFWIKEMFDYIMGDVVSTNKMPYSKFNFTKSGSILDSGKVVQGNNNNIEFKIGNKLVSESELLNDADLRLQFIEDMFVDIRNYIQANPESAPAFARFVHETNNSQNNILKISAGLVSIPVNINGKVVYIKTRQEHVAPQSMIRNILLGEAINKNGNIKQAMKLIKAINVQAALSLEANEFSDTGHDGQIDKTTISPDSKKTLKDNVPAFFWENIAPRILEGKLDNLKRGAVILGSRYSAAGINQNLYRLLGANGQTTTEYFGVGKVNNASQYIVDVQNELIIKQLFGVITKAEATKMFKSALKLDGMVKLSKSKIKTNHAVRDAHNTIIKYSKTGKTRGMSTFDFDETVGISENFIVAKKGNITEKIASDQWPFVGDDMIADGWTMDFSDFDKVTKGKPGPLFKKMENQIAKYGPDNVFILTARGPGSQTAIHEWLKQNGINIPLKNVTGLGQSSGNAKAQWMLDKFAEGYNDMYFVDDALPNVKAVKKVLDQLDIKSKVVQAKIKFSRSLDIDFNKMIERSKGIKAGKVVSAAEAKIRGKKAKVDFFVPPAAEDFRGLVRKIIGRGKQGDTDLAWFKKSLFDPFGKSYMQWNQYKQNMVDEYIELKKQFPKTIKSLKKKVPGMVYTNDTAARVYLWDKAGYAIPGLSTKEQSKLVEHVNETAELKAFADGLGVISRVKEGYIKPNEFWTVETIATDLSNTVSKIGRNQFLGEWIQNKNVVFSKENLNKLEAVYGTDYIDALKDVLYRMETGSNRATGKNKQVNRMLDWVNGSVGAIMFLNIRSAALQTISMVNFLDFKNNNIFKASKAFANQKQFWKDFMFLMNSPMLKQRRAGLQIDVSASELTKAYAEGKGKPQAIIAYLLEKGFTPTKVADSFAIAFGGSTFYRNQLNAYLKQGMSEAKAKDQAFLDFQEIAEETQQSSRPDMISMQQAGPLGRLILAFQNTPAQMTRLTKKGIQDLANRRGSAKANVSKILYFGLVQNLIFGALQSALFALAWADEEELEERYKKKEVRIANGALDTLLRGSGLTGAIFATIKNTYMQWRVQRKKPYGKREDFRIMQELINLSPPMGSKFRKIMSAIKTEQYNKGVGKKIGFRIENPNFHMIANIIEATTNAPIARALRKANNLEEAITGNHTAMQRVFLGMGWDMWSLGIEDEELTKAKKEVRQDRKDAKKNIKKKPFVDGGDRDGDGIKEYRCTGISKSTGKRCKNKGEYGKKRRCYAHQ